MSDYTVVVGVSDTSNSPVALHWAVMQAEPLDGRVVAVRAWKLPPATASRRPSASGLAHDAETVLGDARRRLAEDVASVLGPEHGVEIRLVQGGRRKVLTAQSGDADLLVVGAYPDGMSWDLRRGDPAEYEEVRANIAAVPLPAGDPVGGADGALPPLWSA